MSQLLAKCSTGWFISNALVVKKTKLFSKNLRKKYYYKISEITQKSQKSTSNFFFFFLDQGHIFGTKK